MRGFSFLFFCLSPGVIFDVLFRVGRRHWADASAENQKTGSVKDESSACGQVAEVGAETSRTEMKM